MYMIYRTDDQFIGHKKEYKIERGIFTNYQPSILKGAKKIPFSLTTFKTDDMANI